MALTKLQIEMYIDNDGGVCPYCESDDIDTDEYDHVLCLSCNKEWDNITTLTGIHEEE